ncbi:AraC family transcriptional regulator [Hallella bergensis]|uniref:AraC family transcriptional regulator n=1 Tax=Hallella bergensis TaxID=242750 RepID=UPI0039908F87
MQKSKYMIANAHDSLWGLTVSTVGYEEIAPGDEYPTHGHADGYYFRPEKGRILNEYQLLYITEGEGVFSSTSVKKAKLRAGDLFMLFPGEWHSYHPTPDVGWKSHWIGFRGKNVDDRVNAGFLSPRKPIYHVGFSARVDDTYRFAFETAQEEGAYVQQTLAGAVNLLVGLMYSLERNLQLRSNHDHVDMVNHGRHRIRESLEADLTIQQIAEEMSVSYSKFRKLFKEFTGVSPSLYQQELRLQRAKELLTTTDLSIKQIAYQLRFESPDYFSSKFRAKTGMKPSQYREQTR